MNMANKNSALEFADSFIGRFEGGIPTFIVLEVALWNDAEANFLMTDGEIRVQIP